MVVAAVDGNVFRECVRKLIIDIGDLVNMG